MLTNDELAAAIKDAYEMATRCDSSRNIGGGMYYDEGGASRLAEVTRTHLVELMQAQRARAIPATPGVA